MRADDLPYVNICHNMRQKTVIDYLNGAKKKTGTDQGLLLIEISCGNVFFFALWFQQEPSADDSKLLRNWLMQHVKITIWCRRKIANLWGEYMLWTTGTYSRNMLSETVLHCLLSGCMHFSSLFPFPPPTNHSLTPAKVFYSALFNFNRSYFDMKRGALPWFIKFSKVSMSDCEPIY